MLAKRISHLKPGDVFIWGNARTRENMCVRGELLGPLVCVRVEPPKAGRDGDSEIFFLPRSGRKDSRWYRSSDIAIVAVNGLDTLVRHAVMCDQCNESYGRHAGVLCPGDRERYFVPNQSELELFHREELRKALSESDCDDFFDSIGL